MIRIVIVTFGVLVTLSVNAEEAGTITQVEGNVKIFSHPQKSGSTLAGPAPHAKFEGMFYSVRDAKLGERVKTGNILRTLEGGKVRVVYDNGDQFNVGESTSFRLEKTDGAQAKVDYGQIRGIISKNGPRRRLRIQTKSATMGIRGTDFFVKDSGWRGQTEVSVLRGQVNVEKSSKNEKPVEIKPGFKAHIEREKEEKKSVEKKLVTVARIDKTDLLTIQHISTIQQSMPTEVKKDLREKIDNLEIKAKDMTLNDIKEADPKLFEEIRKKDGVSTTASNLNSEVVKTIYKVAPVGKSSKPGEDELSDLEKDAYEKYFEAN